MPLTDPVARPPKRHPTTSILVVPCLFVIVTFLFWYQTWFGRQLSDRDMQQYLTEISVPHKTQHALAQMADRMARGDASAQRWYPQVLALAQSPEPLLRLTAAWVMGQDATSGAFHQALLGMLHDSDVRVEWNAALALVRFHDDAGRFQLRQMLSPYAFAASASGVLDLKAKPREACRAGEVLGHIQPGSGAVAEVRAPVDGAVLGWDVADRATVSTGQPLGRITPSEDQVWEALRGLYLVGGAEDLEAVRKFARGSEGISTRVKQQAEITAQAIEKRIGSRQTPS